MSAIVFHSVTCKSPEAPALSELELDVVFEVLDEGLMDDMDLKLSYIHAEENLNGKLAALDEDTRISENDELLDELACGPLAKVGKRRVQLLGEHPVFDNMSEKAKLDVAGLVVSASYQRREFYRIGWYVRHEYADAELNLEENRPVKTDMTKCVRRVRVENPIETKLEIPWGEILAKDREVTGHEAKRRKVAESEQSASGAKVDLTKSPSQPEGKATEKRLLPRRDEGEVPPNRVEVE